MSSMPTSHVDADAVCGLGNGLTSNVLCSEGHNAAHSNGGLAGGWSGRCVTHGRTRTEKSVGVGEGPCRSVSSPELAANAALSLLNLCCHLLDRQLKSQAAAFEAEGGFSERLYRVRRQRRERS